MTQLWTTQAFPLSHAIGNLLAGAGGRAFFEGSPCDDRKLIEIISPADLAPQYERGAGMACHIQVRSTYAGIDRAGAPAQ